MPTKNRYRFYREHKFVIAFVNDVGRLIARANFDNDDDLYEVKQKITQLSGLLSAHAAHEESAFHSLLKQKGSTIHEKIAEDHANHEKIFADWQAQLQTIATTDSAEEKIAKGYQFYLSFRRFEADNLQHLNEEETLLMTELQKLYTDEELELVERHTYQKPEMTPEALLHMLTTLIPYMNNDDLRAFLSDIQKADQDKFLATMDRLKIEGSSLDIEQIINEFI